MKAQTGGPEPNIQTTIRHYIRTLDPMKISRNGPEQVQEFTIEQGQRGSLGDARSKSGLGKTTTKAIRRHNNHKNQGKKGKCRKFRDIQPQIRARITSTVSLTKTDDESIPDGGC